MGQSLTSKPRALTIRLSIVGLIISFFPCLATAAAKYPNGPSLDGIELLQPVPYHGGSRSTLGGLASSIGGKFFSPKMGTEQIRKVLQKYEDVLLIRQDPGSKEVSGFFSRKELNDLAVGAGNLLVTRPNLTDGINLLTTYVSANIINRVMSTKVKGAPDRQEKWVHKLLGPLASCMDSAGGPLQAMSCTDSFSEGLKLNIGLAVLFELGHQNFGQMVRENAESRFLKQNPKRKPGTEIGEREEKAFLKALTEQYKSCLRQLPDVESCILRTVRDATVEVAMPRVNATIASEFKSEKRFRTASKFLESGFRKCLSNAEDEKGFGECVDSLTIESGKITIDENVLHHPSILETFPDAQVRRELSSKEQGVFERCAQEQKRDKKRDGAVIAIDRCIDLVTNDLTYRVASDEIKASVAANFAPNPNPPPVPPNAEEKRIAEGNKAGLRRATEASMAALDRCWRRDQNEAAREACLRSAVFKTASTIASIKIDILTDNEFVTEKSGEKARYLKNFESCVTKRLPRNISKAKNIGDQLSACATPLRRDAALGYSEFRLRKAAEKELESAVLNKVVKEEVKANFAKCLGSSPTERQLEICGLQFKKRAAKAIARVRLPNELSKLMPKVTDPKLAKERLRKQKKAGTAIVKAFEGCIDANLTEKHLREADQRTDLCTKRSIDDIARFVASTEFEDKVADLYSGDPDRMMELERVLISAFDACLTGIADKASIDDYVLGAKSCGDQLSERATLVVFKDQIERLLKGLDPVPETANEGTASCSTCGENAAPGDLFQDLTGSMTEILKQYLDYDSGRARDDLKRLVAKLDELLKRPKLTNVRQELLEWLGRETEVLRQLVKAYVRNLTIQELNSLPYEFAEIIPPHLRSAITEKAVFDSVFDTDGGKAIIQGITDEVIRPVLIGNKDMNAPEIVAATAQKRKDVINKLMNFPGFGGALALGIIQANIDSELPLKRLKKNFPRAYTWLARKGGYKIRWEEARKSDEGRIAESHMIEMIRRKLLGEFSDREFEEQMIEARVKVEAAVKARSATARRDSSFAK
ncbi:MAG TPA: hypothetical protein VJB59_02175 [Bdellovibrionota bacterium]|nr:hypothetical protein [Bdellovibrionota bacterium]